MLSCRIYSGIASKAKKGGPQATFFLLYKIIVDKVFFVYIIYVNGVFIMKTKILCALIAVATSFVMLVGCSDSDGNNVTGSDDSLVTVPPNTAELKGESFDYKASACKEMLAKRYNGEGEEYIDFRIKDDGSAIVNIEMAMSCDGFVSMVYETRNDTLFATQNYTRVKKALDPLTGDSVVVGTEEYRTHCACLVDLELHIPAEFIGTKYAEFEGDYRTIVYKKKK